ncbi:MAG TPA: hypothetical protein VI078_03620, partial [bacterium]
RLAAAVHFGAIGLGTAVAGVGLLAHVQVVGSPAPAVATLAVFLAAGAVGSARAQRPFAAAAAQRRRCGVLAVVLMLAAALVPALAGVIGGAPLWSRLVVAGAAAGFLGYLLGSPFPGALALLGERLLVAWGWAVWAAFSVLGLAAALLVAATSGFATTLLAGAACFLVAGALAEVCG